MNLILLIHERTSFKTEYVVYQVMYCNPQYTKIISRITFQTHNYQPLKPSETLSIALFSELMMSVSWVSISISGMAGDLLDSIAIICVGLIAIVARCITAIVANSGIAVIVGRSLVSITHTATHLMMKILCIRWRFNNYKSFWVFLAFEGGRLKFRSLITLILDLMLIDFK